MKHQKERSNCSLCEDNAIYGKFCKLHYFQQYYQKNKELYNLRSSNWRKNNPQRIKQIQRRADKKRKAFKTLDKYLRYWNNPEVRERELAKNRNWIKNHSNYNKLRKRKYYIKNKEIIIFKNWLFRAIK